MHFNFPRTPLQSRDQHRLPTPFKVVIYENGGYKIPAVGRGVKELKSCAVISNASRFLPLL